MRTPDGAAARVLDAVRAVGFTLFLEDGRLMAEPFSRLSALQLATLRAHKPALMALLQTEVRCCNCRHAKPATTGNPYCWHSCGQGLKNGGGWGMAPRHCETWEALARAKSCDGNASASVALPNTSRLASCERKLDENPISSGMGS